MKAYENLLLSTLFANIKLYLNLNPAILFLLDEGEYMTGYNSGIKYTQVWFYRPLLFDPELILFEWLLP